MSEPPTTRTNADGFKGEYPKYVDLSKLPPAKLPWLTEPADEEEDGKVAGPREPEEPPGERIARIN